MLYAYGDTRAHVPADGGVEESWDLHHNPAAGALWTPGDVNAGMEFGLRPPRVTQAYVQVTYRVATESTVYIGGVYERKGDGSVTKYYAALGRVIAGRQVPVGGGGGTLSWLLADHLGSAVGVLDAGGALVPGSKQQYWPYGATRSGGLPQTDKQYTGQQVEGGDQALGLYNYRARFYSTALGRFVSADTVVPRPDPNGLNRFAYASNSPTNFNDISGHCFEFFGQVIKECTAQNIVNTVRCAMALDGCTGNLWFLAVQVLKQAIFWTNADSFTGPTAA